MFNQGRSSPERAAKVRTIKDWAREALSLPEEGVVMATELRCTEPGCPPLETVVAVMGDGESRQFKIHKGIEDVTYEDVERGAASMLRGVAHHHGPPAPPAPPTER